MCFGGKSKAAPPPPAPVNTVATNGVADTSNDAQRKAAAIANTTNPAPLATFGSELGSSNGAPTQ
jgi:hypothetical protein